MPDMHTATPINLANLLEMLTKPIHELELIRQVLNLLLSRLIPRLSNPQMLQMPSSMQVMSYSDTVQDLYRWVLDLQERLYQGR